MARPKAYASEAYLKLQFHVLKKTIEQVAMENNVSPNTIRNAIKKIGFKI